MTADDGLYDRLTPKCQLVLEVLAARERLGHTSWTFPLKKNGQTFDRLQRAGLVGWKYGVMPDSALAWLTETGRELMLMDGYVPPILGGKP